jgi:hypothetical protein
MKQWEYKITNIFEIKWLNDMGLKGWEVCAMNKETPTSVTVIILKREIIDQK